LRCSERDNQSDHSKKKPDCDDDVNECRQEHVVYVIDVGQTEQNNNDDSFIDCIVQGHEVTLQCLENIMHRVKRAMFAECSSHHVSDVRVSGQQEFHDIFELIKGDTAVESDHDR